MSEHAAYSCDLAYRHRRPVTVRGLLPILLAAACPAADSAQTPVETPALEEPASITQELLHSLESIDQELAAQQQRVAAASTDEERQRLQDRLRALQADRQALEYLLRSLAGQEVELRDEARDRKHEQRTIQDESTLELQP